MDSMLGKPEKWQRDDKRWSRWMRQSQAGDRQAYTQLLTELADVIHQFLLVRYGRAVWLEDMAQECLLAIHKGRHTYDVKRAFRPWMFAIVRNRSVDFLRSEKPQRYSTDPTERNDEPGYEPDQLMPIDLAKSLSRLNPDYCEALTLTKYIGLSIDEAADWAGVSDTAMKTRVSRAVKALRKQLENEGLAYE